MKSDTSCEGSTTLGTQQLGAPSHQPLLNITSLKNIDDLPDSLLVEILCRLPCKFVVRCKCVCKSWSTLISIPYFESRRALYIRDNCEDNKQVPMFVPYCHTFPGYGPVGLLTFSKQSSSPGLKLKPLDFDPSSLFAFNRVVATYNDLILLCCLEYHERKDIYYICNPYTKQWVALPQAPPCDNLMDVRVGFACDSDNRCCKVARLLDYRLEARSLKYPEKLEVQIFSSDDETGKWIESYLVLQGSYISSDRFDSIDARDTPVAQNGTLYWVTTCGNLIALELFSKMKMNMNSTTYQGRFISSPRYENRDRVGEASLSVCQGFLRLCYLVRAPESPENRYDTLLCVWELKEDEQWCFKELVDLRSFESSFPIMRHLGFDPNDQEILYQWRTPPSSATADIVMCNIRKLTLTEISDKFKACGSVNSFVFVLPWWRWPTPVPRLN